MLLDRVAAVFLSGSGAEVCPLSLSSRKTRSIRLPSQQAQAQSVLTQFQDYPDSWQKVPEILERSSNTQTKYIALQIMDKLIKARWKVLPEEQRSGIRNFIVGVIVKTSSDEATLRKEKAYVNKLNLILVQILKQEWSVWSFLTRHSCTDVIC